MGAAGPQASPAVFKVSVRWALVRRALPPATPLPLPPLRPPPRARPAAPRSPAAAPPWRSGAPGQGGASREEREEGTVQGVRETRGSRGRQEKEQQHRQRGLQSHSCSSPKLTSARLKNTLPKPHRMRRNQRPHSHPRPHSAPTRSSPTSRSRSPSCAMRCVISRADWSCSSCSWSFSEASRWQGTQVAVGAV